MTAGAEVVCNDVARKVEIEEKLVAGFNTCDLNGVGDVAAVDGNVDGKGNGYVAVKGKEDTDDSSYVFVSGGTEVSAGDPHDTGGVHDDDFVPLSGSTDEAHQSKEDFGIENGGIPVDPLALETKGIDHGSNIISDSEVKAVTDAVHLENGSTVDPLVVLVSNAIVEEVNGHLENNSGEKTLAKSTEEVDDPKEMQDVETKLDHIGSGVTFDPEFTLNTKECSQVTVTEPDSIVHQSDATITKSLSTPDATDTTDVSFTAPHTVSSTDCGVMVSNEPDSINNLNDVAECQVIVDGSGIPSDDLKFQVTANGSESSGSPTEEQDAHITVYESGNPSKDLASEVTANKPESFETPIKEQECDVPVDGSDPIGSLVDNQESPVPEESEFNGTHTEEVDGRSEEHQEVLVITSEVNVVEAEHETVLVSVPYQSEDKKAEGTESGIVLSENTGAMANGEAEKFDGILETAETQISETVSERSELLMNEKPEEKQIEGSSESILKITESVETGADAEDMKEEVNIEDGIQGSRTVVTDVVQDDLKLEDNTTKSASGAELPLETETNSEPIVHVSTVSQYEFNSSIDKPQEVFQQEESSETIKSDGDSDDLLVVEDNDSLSNPDELIVLEQKDEIVPHMVSENRAAKGMDCEIGAEAVDVFDYEEERTEVKDIPVETVHLVKENISAEGMECGTQAENIVFPDDEEKETEVKDDPVRDHPTLRFPDTIVNHGAGAVAVIKFGSFGHHETTHNKQKEVEDTDATQSDEFPTSSADGSLIDATDVQNEVAEVLPYNFLIKIPRFEDENFRDQIRSAQLLVDEKTRVRDAIRVQIQEKRAKLKAHNEAYNTAKMEETAARRLVRLKRQEIDSVQVLINRWKNAMSVEDIDNRISNMEHMIQHETLPLKDEKQFIREIKQLKTLRDQLASNMGSPEEIQQAVDQKDRNEEHMKILRKELDSLKDKVSKAETVVKTIGKTYDEESRKERDLQSQFRAADDVRQKVYAQLNSLKKLSYEKNTNFRQFKEDVMAARDFASHGNKDALHRLCANQVETFMEQWNSNDEFRKDYISRCSMLASRRHRAIDAGPLVPDDVVSALPADVVEKANDSLVSVPGNMKPVSVVSIPVKDKNSNKAIENVSGQKNQTLKTKGVGKPAAMESAEVAVVAEVLADDRKEEENRLTKEEIESTRKAEELRREEIAASLKEQRRQEEKAKAIEALERKKRNAEKAQIRAEIRARKEAEQKEKEREKRLRKKEKKKTGGGDGSMNGEEAAVVAAASSESSNEAITKDTETISKETNKRKTQPPAQVPPQHFSKQQRLQVKPKPIPPPLVNRNKKRWQQWGKAAVAVGAIFCLFMLGNTNYFRQMFNGLI